MVPDLLPSQVLAEGRVKPPRPQRPPPAPPVLEPRELISSSSSSPPAPGSVPFPSSTPSPSTIRTVDPSAPPSHVPQPIGNYEIAGERAKQLTDHLLPVNPSSISDIGQVNIGTVGLKNLGNTCFMNSVLQCLFATSPLSRYFSDGSYKRHVNMDSRLGTQGELSNAFADLMRNMWSAQYTVITPVTLKKVVGKYHEDFRGQEQHDAQEFLGFILDRLHEDLNRPDLRPRPDLDALLNNDDAFEALDDHVAADVAWQGYGRRNSSLIASIFQGQFRSRLTCSVCSATSTTYNPFMSLSLPIPKPAPSHREVSLRACVDAFVRGEVLEGEDAWHCPKCKCRRRATKELSISRLPDILVIHLKRFSFDGPFRDKLDTPVSFPIRSLDLTGYLPQDASVEGSHLFDLYGVVNHFGGLTGGHYISTIRSVYSDQWSTFDDSRVSKCDEDHVATSAAYILFYVRQSIL